MHEGRDTIGYFGNAEPALAGAERQAIPRQGRRHDGEGVACVAAEACRIGEARNELEKLEHRAGPTVQQKQRHGVGGDAGHMQVVQVDAVERDAELRKSVQRGFRGSPVKMVAPVFGEFAEIDDIGAIGPWITGRLVGEARAGETVAQIGDVGVRDTQREWGGFDGHDPARPVGQTAQFLETFSSRPAAVAACQRTAYAYHASCRRCALRTYIALSASSSALPASALRPRIATPMDAPAVTGRPRNTNESRSTACSRAAALALASA